eukprot:6188060-Pleurochrysis_carterae.AAC.1
MSKQRLNTSNCDNHIREQPYSGSALMMHSTPLLYCALAPSATWRRHGVAVPCRGLSTEPCRQHFQLFCPTKCRALLSDCKRRARRAESSTLAEQVEMHFALEDAANENATANDTASSEQISDVKPQTSSNDTTDLATEDVKNGPAGSNEQQDSQERQNGAETSTSNNDAEANLTTAEQEGKQVPIHTARAKRGTPGMHSAERARAYLTDLKFSMRGPAKRRATTTVDTEKLRENVSRTNKRFWSEYRTQARKKDHLGARVLSFKSCRRAVGRRTRKCVQCRSSLVDLRCFGLDAQMHENFQDTDTMARCAREAACLA